MWLVWVYLVVGIVMSDVDDFDLVVVVVDGVDDVVIIVVG